MELYSDKHICLEQFKDSTGRIYYRATLFNENNHWDGEITFNGDGVISNDL